MPSRAASASLLRKPHRGRVLVVDRDERSRTTVRRAVEYDGHEVRQAADGVEALWLIKEFRPHVVLLHPMPPAEAPPDPEDASGQPPFAEASIVPTSAEESEHPYSRWVVGRITRPFDLVELRLLISREVGRRIA